MHGIDDADELASAMAAAAQDTPPVQGYLEVACRFATVIWDRFSLTLLDATERPHKQFVHLIHELGMDKLAMQIADRLKVCHSTSTSCHHHYQGNNKMHSCHVENNQHLVTPCSLLLISLILACSPHFPVDAQFGKIKAKSGVSGEICFILVASSI